MTMVNISNVAVKCTSNIIEVYESNEMERAGVNVVK